MDRYLFVATFLLAAFALAQGPFLVATAADARKRPGCGRPSGGNRNRLEGASLNDGSWPHSPSGNVCQRNSKLDGELKRELLIGREPYTLTLSPQGFTLALRGRRKGLDVAWADLVSGDAALATALNASLKANIRPTPAKPPSKDKHKVLPRRSKRP